MRVSVYIFLALTVVLGLFGCTPTEKKVDVPPPPTAGEQATQAPTPASPAPQGQQPESAKKVIEDYHKGLTTSIDKAKSVQAKVDMGAVQDAVRNYQVENGRCPEGLDAIKSYVGPKVNLSLYNYDPGTGTVSLK